MKIIKSVFFAFLAVSVCPAAQSIVLQNGATLTGTFPVNPAFNAIGDIRMEFRLHNFSQPPVYFAWLFQFNQFYAMLSPSDGILNITDEVDNANSKAFTNLVLAGRTDVIVRFQKDQANNRLTAEAWNTDGSGYIYVVAPLSTFKTVKVSGTPTVFGAPPTSTDLAYFRMYSSVLPLNSPPPSLTSGDLADWEFEGNLNDQSGHGVNLSGAISYVATPSRPITVGFGQFGTQRVWSANHGSILLDGSSTYSSVDNPSYTYTWSQISGPAAGSFSTPNAVTTSFSAFLPGDYQIRLTASDGVTTNSMDVDIGAVNTDETGIIQTGNPSMDIALGPLSMWGTSPWPWYDLTEMADADALYPLVTVPPVYGQTALAGTITAVNGNSTVTGVGTNFYRDLTDCDPASGSGSAYTCTSNVPYSSLSDIGLRDRYFIPDVKCTGAPTLNINSTIVLPVYTAGTNTPASCTAGTIYQIKIQGCLTSGGAICSGGVQWTGSTAFAYSSTVLDSAYHVQYATGAGISAGSLPAWNDSGGTTTDGTVTWQDKGLAFYTIAPGSPLVWFWWNAPDGAGTGRIWLPISTINSPTSLTLYYYGGYVGPTAQSAGIQYSNPSLPELGIYWNFTGQPSNNLNYYDVVHALYKLYYRTSLTKYLTEARTFADNWYKYATGQGYYYGAPRAMAYLGMIDRAIDGHPTIWKALDQYFSSSLAALFQTSTPQSVGFQFDTRETGYEVRYMARMAALDPDPGWHATACSYLHNIVNNIYHPVQDSLGQWEVDSYSGNPSYPGAKLNGKFGSSPWRDAMSGLALEESYDILTNNCGDAATAGVALSTVINEANFTHDYGEGKVVGGSGFGQIYNVMYGSMAETNIHGYTTTGAGEYIAPVTTGTLSVTAGSANVVGTGTNFKTIFSALYQGATPQAGIDPAYIGIPAILSGSCSQVLPVASVTDDTHLTLAAGWPCASASGVNGNGFGWVGTPPAGVNCASYGSMSLTCEEPPDPSLSHEIHAMWSWLYWRTGNGKYLTWAEESAGTDYGGSGGGPGSPLPPAGPYAAGTPGNFLSALPSCGTPPCGGYGEPVSLGKDFGFSAGAGNADNAFAYMLLGAPPPAVSPTPALPVTPATPVTPTPAMQTITFAALSSVATGSVPFAVNATASSGLPVNFASTTPAVCTVSGSTVTIVAAGACSITASQPGDATWAAAPGVSQGFTVLPVQGAMTVVPTFLNFTYRLGDPAPPPSQIISVFDNKAVSDFAALASSTANWLSASGAGTTPGSVAVSVDVSKLAAGTYTGNVTISSASAASVVTPVTITVSNAAPAVLSVSPRTEMFSLAQGSSAANELETVSNTGGGTLQFSAQATSDKGWLALNGSSSGSATPSAPASLAFMINPSGLNPGLYSGAITVSDSNSSNKAVVNVLLTVTNTAQSIQLSQNGLTLTTVAGGAQPQAQSFTVGNSGTGTLDWTAQTSTLSGGAWLSVSSGSGASSGGQAGVPVSVSANTTDLPVGQYYGSINIASTGITNSPQIISVILNVMASQPSPGEKISVGGVLLVGPAGSSTPVTQTVNVFNPSGSAVTYSASTFTGDGGGWLSISPASGAVSPGANSIQIMATLSGLTAGIQSGTLRLSFDDGSVATLQVVVLVTGAGTAGNSAIAKIAAKATTVRPLQALTACPGGKASFLIPIFQQPVSQAVVQVSAPQTLQVEVIDDCGNPVAASGGGSVQVTFNNNDAGIDLHDVGSGIWDATWTPVNAASQVTLQVSASEQGLTLDPSLSSNVTVTVQASSSSSAPQPAGGIANAASAGQATPQVVAPGSYVSIYGTNLGNAGSESATSVPVSTTLDGAQLFLGGLPMPLFYASPGQVNALVPQGLAPNSTYSLVVVRGTTQSVPVPLIVTALQPGIYTVNLSGSGPGVVTNALTGQLNSASAPAHASDYLTIYCTGLGPLLGPNGEAQPADGEAAPSNLIFHTSANVTSTIGGVSASVLFAGLAPGFVGLYQVNVQLPAGAAAGNNVPLVLTATASSTGISAQSNSVDIDIQ